MAAIKYGIQEKPFVAVKADAGSYGMAVMMLQDAEEIKNLTDELQIIGEKHEKLRVLKNQYQYLIDIHDENIN